jgi:hypothetical protein
MSKNNTTHNIISESLHPHITYISIVQPFAKNIRNNDGNCNMIGRPSAVNGISTLSQEGASANCDASKRVAPSNSSILTCSEVALYPQCSSWLLPGATAGITMQRAWRKADFELIELLHQGYASHVYKVAYIRIWLELLQEFR